MSESKLLRGTFVLTLGTYISRILGMIYLFPFAALVGDVGGALFGYGYNQYAIYLSIATMGVPMAVSRFVSKYNALGDYYTSRRMFRAGIKMMFITGLVTFAFLYIMAPFLAKATLGNQELNNSLADVTMVIRMVSVALIIVPMMSIIRGFFQGHQSMGPTSVSQVVEQLARVVFLLVSTYIVMRVFHGSMALAVGFATFGAFIGALAGLAVLFWYWKKRKPNLDKLLAQSVEPAQMTTMQMFKELFSYAGPFVFIGLAIPLYQYIDQFTFNKAMVAAGQADKAEYMYGIIQSWVPKLIMIPVSLATAFGLTLVPTITSSYASGQYDLLKKQIDQTYQTIMFLVLPAVVGLIVLAYPAYNFLFTGSKDGGFVLMMYAPVALLFSYFTVNAAILQGINKQKYAVISLIVGLIVKISTNSLFIMWLGGTGSIVSTALGYVISIVYTSAMIQNNAEYKATVFWKRTVLMFAFAALMGLSVWIVEFLLSFAVNYEDGRIAAGIITIAGATVGLAVYGILTYRTGLLEKVMGSRIVGVIQRRLLRKKVSKAS
ncbi:putative polysaccharide biosynthesis protein [Priestia koreensis]|uniref:Cell division protein n=1 Tax=Priestia koreensis TaxID=284581 RepID=A0A0M0L6T3_9BACI|nr:polysaccharide biosynthesis protein [Priestia koreensis]KOO46786.1 cell division protein [Priestia koreensis]